MATKLYIGNLSFSTTESDLRQAFAAFGDVASCSVITDRETGRPRGFAFVEMASADAAANAVAEMNGKDLGGRALVVNEARARDERGRGGGFGGGHGGGRNRY